MSRARRGRPWRGFAAASQELREQASAPGGIFRCSCPCGAEFAVPTGPSGAAEVEALTFLHMQQVHPGFVTELLDLMCRGVPEEIGAIFVENWKRGVREP